MTFAQRPVNQIEVKYALAIHRIGQNTFDEKYFYHINYMVTACQELIEVEESSNIMQLFHPTTQEYLRQHIFRIDSTGSLSIFHPNSDQRDLSVRSILEVHREMCLVCITYLFFKQFQKIDTNQLVKKSSQKDNFLAYAAVNWGLHANLAWQSLDRAEKGFVFSFVESRKLANAYQVFLEQAKTTDSSYWMQLGRDEFTDPVTIPLAIVVELCVSQVVAELLRRPGHNPNSRDKHGVPTLSRAARLGNLEIVKMLVDKGAFPFPTLPIPSTPFGSPTPLHEAAIQGQRTVVNFLLSIPTVRGERNDESMTQLRNQHAQWALSAVPLYGRPEIVHEMLKVFRDAGFGPPREFNPKVIEARIAMSTPEKRRRMRESGQSVDPFWPSPPPPEQLPLPSFLKF